LGIRTCLPVGLSDGQDCTAGGDLVCAGGLCMLDENNRFFCTRPCNSDADCSWPRVCDLGFDCSKGCREAYLPAPEGECSRTLDCKQGSVCVPQAGSGRWVYRCLPAQKCGDGEGVACQSSRFCHSRFCGPDSICTLACQGLLDCPRGQDCASGEFSLPTGGVYPLIICRPGLGGEVGEPCQNDGDCREDSCLRLDAFRGRCSKPCNTSADCPDNFFCRPVEDKSFCWPEAFSGKCASDQDCLPGLSCALVGEPLQLECANREELLPAGERCKENSECRSGLCIAEGLCSALCAVGEDCPIGMVCELEELSIAGQRGFLRHCILPASGKICWSSWDCPQGEVCRLYYFTSGLGPDGRCRPFGTGASAGEECISSAGCADGECTSTGLCAPLCVEDGDCPQGFECRSERVAAFDLVLKLCLDIARRLGENCPQGDSDCTSGLFCHDFSGAGPLCTRECSTWYDCDPAGGFDCLDEGEGRLLCRPR